MGYIIAFFWTFSLNILSIFGNISRICDSLISRESSEFRSASKACIQFVKYILLELLQQSRKQHLNSQNSTT